MKKHLILCGTLLGMIFSAGTIYADGEPNITTQFDVSNMNQYSDNQLEEAVSINKFYIKDLGKDHMGQYHMLLTPTKHSDQYFLVVTDKKKTLHIGQKVNLEGQLNGRGKINHNQIASGISRIYANKSVILYLADSYKPVK